MTDHDTEMLRLNALNLQARAQHLTAEHRLQRLAAGLPTHLETRSRKEIPVTTKTTITTADFRKFSPWSKAGSLDGKLVMASYTSSGPDKLLITRAEHDFHAAEVAAQDAKIEAFRLEVTGMTPPEAIEEVTP
ncbi:hypothetical protein CH252_40650 [Rhodococcus sp. 06-1477-1B]|nr:hypothetical protein CH252_40650 [Rhodococcus sp. 06-1477-1B]